MFSRFFVWLGFAALILFLGCDVNDERTITISYLDWEEDIAMSNVVKIILEENGYKVKFRMGDIEPIFRNLARNKSDVFLDIWETNTHKEYLEKYGSSIDVLEATYQEAQTGLAVPGYVSINSIEELNSQKDKFNAQIIGIDIGAGIMKSTEKAISGYKLEFELKNSSATKMTNQLRKAIADEKWIVVTGWTPNPMFSNFDLKFLDDPKNIYGDTEAIHPITRKGFSEEYPFVAELLSNMSFSTEQMASLMDAMDGGELEFEAAEEWVKRNRELVDSWIPEKQ